MITETILAGFQTIVTAVLYLVPSLPQMSAGIQDATDFLVNSVNQTIGLISYIYTPAVTVFVFTILLAILLFDPIYNLILWVLHKVRG